MMRCLQLGLVVWIALESHRDESSCMNSAALQLRKTQTRSREFQRAEVKKPHLLSCNGSYMLPPVVKSLKACCARSCQLMFQLSTIRLLPSAKVVGWMGTLSTQSLFHHVIDTRGCHRTGCRPSEVPSDRPPPCFSCRPSDEHVREQTQDGSSPLKRKHRENGMWNEARDAHDTKRHHPDTFYEQRRRSRSRSHHSQSDYSSSVDRSDHTLHRRDDAVPHRHQPQRNQQWQNEYPSQQHFVQQPHSIERSRYHPEPRWSQPHTTRNSQVGNQSRHTKTSRSDWEPMAKHNHRERELYEYDTGYRSLATVNRHCVSAR